ncbi:MAG: hypothetical protein ACK5YO_03560, partial [Planctomyces sp.]
RIARSESTTGGEEQENFGCQICPRTVNLPFWTNQPSVTPWQHMDPDYWPQGICVASLVVAFCLVLGEAEAGSAGKQPAEENLSLASKRRRGGD